MSCLWFGGRAGVSQHAMGQTPSVDRQTHVKTQPSQTSFAGGKNSLSRSLSLSVNEHFMTHDTCQFLTFKHDLAQIPTQYTESCLRSICIGDCKCSFVSISSKFRMGVCLIFRHVNCDSLTPWYNNRNHFVPESQQQCT